MLHGGQRLKWTDVLGPSDPTFWITTSTPKGKYHAKEPELMTCTFVSARSPRRNDRSFTKILFDQLQVIIGALFRASISKFLRDNYQFFCFFAILFSPIFLLQEMGGPTDVFRHLKGTFLSIFRIILPFGTSFIIPNFHHLIHSSAPN